MEKIRSQVGTRGEAPRSLDSGARYNVNSVMIRTGTMLFLVVISALLGAYAVLTIPSVAMPVATICSLIVFGLVIWMVVASFRRVHTGMNYNTVKMVTIAYSALIGFPLGVFIPTLTGPVVDLVTIALVGTAVVVVVSWLLISLRIITPGHKFRTVASVGILSVIALYGVNFLLSLTPFGPLLAFGTGVSALVSLVVLVIAAMNISVVVDDMYMLEATGHDAGAEWVTVLSLVSLIVLIFREVLNISSFLSD